MGLTPEKFDIVRPDDKPYKLARSRWAFSAYWPIRWQTLAGMQSLRIVVGVSALAVTSQSWSQENGLLAGILPKVGLEAAIAAESTSQWASVTPLTIQANQNASVTVTAKIPAQYGTSLQPHVFRLNRQTGQITDLGALTAQKPTPDTKTIVYSTRLNFHETAAGQILLQVKVQLPVNVSAARTAQTGITSSGTMTVTVLAGANPGNGASQDGGAPKGTGGWLGGQHPLGQLLGGVPRMLPSAVFPGFLRS